MNTDKIDTWVWMLIYGGMAAVALGLWTLGANAVAGHVLAWSGGAAIVTGIVLIVVRARLPASAPNAKPGAGER